MAPPPASPARVAVKVGASPPSPPPPTYSGHFALLRTQSGGDAPTQKRAMWEYSTDVVEFLLKEIHPRMLARLGYSDATALRNGKALSDAQTALKFSFTGDYSPNRDYSEGFAYVEGGQADALVDAVLGLYDADPVPMPNPRADPEGFEDWSHMNPISYGGRKRKTRRRHHRRGKRTYRHSPRRR